MEPRDLDRLIDETYSRLSQGIPSGPAHSEGALAGDHYLLNRSWEFFRRRLKTVEEQWNEIAASKDARIQSLTSDLETMRKRLDELEKESGERDEIEARLLSERSRDISRFGADATKLKDRWEEERVRLQEELDRSEFQLKQAEAAREKERDRHRLEEAAIRETIERLQKALVDAGDHAAKDRAETLAHLNKKEEDIQSLETRIELLKLEVARRDGAIQELSAQGMDLDREKQALQLSNKEGRLREAAQEQEIERLRLKLDIVEREKNETRASWQREQAEWRELWERSRELWDKKEGEGPFEK